jgi:hypothetical protein
MSPDQRFSAVVLLVVLLPAHAGAEPNAKATPPEDEKLLRSAKVAVDGPGLLELFRQRTPSARDQERVAALAAQLGDEAFAVRQKAANELVAVGARALPQLRRLLAHPEEEVRQRARECIEAIDPHLPGMVTAAAVRQLRLLRTNGAIMVLLDYLPSADTPAVADEILTTLILLGAREGKVDPALATALEGPAPERRAAAALLLGRSGSVEQRAAVRALLRDKEDRVRLCAAQGLVAGRDKEGVPVLIALLNEGPLDLAEQADDVLNTIGLSTAGPRTTLIDNPANRRQCQTAWDSWWKVFGKNLDLARADADLPPFNPLLQTRMVTRRFVNALTQRDVAAFHQVTALPFEIGGTLIFHTRDQAICSFPTMPADGDSKPGFTIGRIMTAEQYARALSKEQKIVLASMLKPENRAVQVHGLFQDQPPPAYVFVHIADGQARVIGVLPSEQYRPPR